MRLECDGFVCRVCGRLGEQEGGEAKLNVHHLTYKNFKNEELEDLITACKDCHKYIHKIRKKRDK